MPVFHADSFALDVLGFHVPPVPGLSVIGRLERLLILVTAHACS